MHTARLIREELDALLRLDESTGDRLVQALSEGRYEIALRLYHEVEGNLEIINVTELNLDQFHKDGPLGLPGRTVDV